MVRGPCCCEFSGILEFIGMITHKKYHKNGMKLLIKFEMFTRTEKIMARMRLSPIGENLYTLYSPP
jgi:hypothetical protein